MKFLVVVCACLAVATAQFEVPIPLWQGPISNHVNGQLVEDTPEVAAAKAKHFQAFSQVEAQLPALPDHIRYQQGQVLEPVLPQQIVPQTIVQQQIVQQPIVSHHDIQPTVQQIQLAEEIPLSPLGETPEVYAARIAHTKIHEHFNSILPRLSETVPQPIHHVPIPQVQVPVYNHIPQQFPFSQNIQYIMDTPEVAAAKAEHARAVASLG